jgi:hypothetical protein
MPNTCRKERQGVPAASVFAAQQLIRRGLLGCLQDGWSVTGVAHAASPVPAVADNVREGGGGANGGAVGQPRSAPSMYRTIDH